MEYLIKKDLLRINRLLQFVIFISLWSVTIILEFDSRFFEGEYVSKTYLFQWSCTGLLMLLLTHFAVRWNFKTKSSRKKLAPIGYIQLGIVVFEFIGLLIAIADGDYILPLLIVALCCWVISSALHLVLAYIKTVDDGGELRG